MWCTRSAACGVPPPRGASSTTAWWAPQEAMLHRKTDLLKSHAPRPEADLLKRSSSTTQRRTSTRGPSFPASTRFSWDALSRWCCWHGVHHHTWTTRTHHLEDHQDERHHLEDHQDERHRFEVPRTAPPPGGPQAIPPPGAPRGEYLLALLVGVLRLRWSSGRAPATRAPGGPSAC